MHLNDIPLCPSPFKQPALREAALREGKEARYVAMWKREKTQQRYRASPLAASLAGPGGGGGRERTQRPQQEKHLLSQPVQETKNKPSTRDIKRCCDHDRTTPPFVAQIEQTHARRRAKHGARYNVNSTGGRVATSGQRCMFSSLPPSTVHGKFTRPSCRSPCFALLSIIYPRARSKKKKKKIHHISKRSPRARPGRAGRTSPAPCSP